MTVTRVNYTNTLLTQADKFTMTCLKPHVYFMLLKINIFKIYIYLMTSSTKIQYVPKN